VYTGPAEYFSSRFCREFLEPLGWGDAIGSHLMKSTNRYSIFAAFAPRASGVIGADKLAYVRTLSPHIRRAVTISDLLDARELREDMLVSALDLLTVGIALTDETGRIAHLNRAAQQFIDTGVAIRKDGDFIAARDTGSSAELNIAIGLAARGHAIDMPASGIAVPLRGVSGRDLAAWVLPLDGGQRKQWGAPMSARVAIFLRELGDTTPFQGEIFVKRYAITPAECHVLMLLLQGLSVNDICAALDRRETTIKTHLSNLFAKTATTSQVDLVRLALSVVAPAARNQS
jgi:DNA-binding CsgD family transcriptional regulator